MVPHRRFGSLKICVLITLLTLFALSTMVEKSDAARRWKLLGKRVVHGRSDHDSIVVAKIRGPFKVLKFEVKGSALEMYDVVIHFGNGTKYSPKTRLIFRRGAWSRTINLPGKNRRITRIDFYYGNLPGGGRARIKVFGH